MIKYSHVSLLIPCDLEDSTTVTTVLGVTPSRIQETKTWGTHGKEEMQECIDYTWTLDSPLSHIEGDPTARLYALAETIEPFGARLHTLDPQFKGWIDIVYHITPQNSHGITGEFEWFRMPADLMRRYGEWNLNISYESFWYDHPDWVRRKRMGWLGRVISAVLNR
jgi:hypothetical protein